MNREQYLLEAGKLMRKMFEDVGAPIPDNVRVSCGWPGGGSRNSRIGECWGTSCSADGHFEIFISPKLGDTLRVLDVLVHEYIHAAVGLEAGHRGYFRRVAKALGLEGKMTATTAGVELGEKLQRIHLKLGDYPHAALSGLNRKKQATRLVKCECGECGYIVRTTDKWLDAYGPPLCPCNEERMEVQS